MFQLQSILDRIQERAQLRHEDGHPLYAYKVTEEELADLQLALRATVIEKGELTWQVDCAAFCIFSAEWFRRYYDAGHWSWETIYNGLNWPELHLSILKKQTHHIVRKGLAWWGHEVIRLELSSRFLGSLVCQGGIPLNALQNQLGVLTRFLKSCLRSYERYPNDNPRAVVEGEKHILPASLQNHDFLHLVATLVQKIAELRRKSDESLNQGCSRRSYLDQHDPAWANSLPLRIDEPKSLELLLALLDSSKAAAVTADKFEVVTSLILPAGNAKNRSVVLARRLQTPSQVTEHELIQQFRLPNSEALFSRLSLHLRAPTTSAAAANLARCQYDSSVGYRIHRNGTSELRGEDTARKVEIVLRGGGQAIFHSEDSNFRVQTKTPNSYGSTYYLVGKQMAFGARNHLVWLGMPDVMESRFDEGGANKPVAPHKIEWRTAKGPWSTNRKGCLGSVRIRVVEDDETKYDARITVLPADFSMEAKPTSQRGKGGLILRNLGDASIELRPIKGLNATVQSAGRMHAINISVEEERPAELLFGVRFSNGGECELPFSCPTNWIGLIDAAGREISREKIIPVDRLGGVRLRIIQSDQKQPEVYEVKDHQFLGLPRSLDSNKSLFEFNLGEIESYARGVLARTDDPDGFVEFGVARDFRGVFDFKWRVSRYSTRLHVNYEDTSLSEEDSQSVVLSVPSEEVIRLNECSDSIQLTLRRLDRPEETVPEQHIEVSELGTWRIRTEKLTPGFYLATAMYSSSGEYLRPLSLCVRGADDRTLRIDDLAIYYLKQEKGTSRALETEVDVEGELIQPCHDDFYEIDFYERFKRGEEG